MDSSNDEVFDLELNLYCSLDRKNYLSSFLPDCFSADCFILSGTFNKKVVPIDILIAYAYLLDSKDRRYWLIAPKNNRMVWTLNIPRLKSIKITTLVYQRSHVEMMKYMDLTDENFESAYSFKRKFVQIMQENNQANRKTGFTFLKPNVKKINLEFDENKAINCWNNKLEYNEIDAMLKLLPKNYNDTHIY